MVAERSVTTVGVLGAVLLIGAVAFSANWIAGQHDQLAERNSFQVIESALDG